MKAKNFRYLFHKVSDGLCYSGCIRDGLSEQQDVFCFLYLAGGELCREEDEAYASAENTYDMLILGDLCRAALMRAGKVLRCCEVREVWLPNAEGMQRACVMALLQENGVKTVRIVEKAETFTRGREEFLLIPAGGAGGSLLLYHEDRCGTLLEEECILNVKPSQAEPGCRARSDESFSCELHCLLYQDSTLCKRHNRKGQHCLVDGQLLFSAQGETKAREAVYLAVHEQLRLHSARLRVTGFADSGLRAEKVRELQTAAQGGLQRYVVGSSRTLPEAVSAISDGDPYKRCFKTSEHAGVCITGCYVPRNRDS